MTLEEKSETIPSNPKSSTTICMEILNIYSFCQCIEETSFDIPNLASYLSKIITFITTSSALIAACAIIYNDDQFIICLITNPDPKSYLSNIHCDLGLKIDINNLFSKTSMDNEYKHKSMDYNSIDKNSMDHINKLP